MFILQRSWFLNMTNPPTKEKGHLKAKELNMFKHTANKDQILLVNVILSSEDKTLLVTLYCRKYHSCRAVEDRVLVPSPSDDETYCESP